MIKGRERKRDTKEGKDWRRRGRAKASSPRHCSYPHYSRQSCHPYWSTTEVCRAGREVTWFFGQASFPFFPADKLSAHHQLLSIFLLDGGGSILCKRACVCACEYVCACVYVCCGPTHNAPQWNDAIVDLHYIIYKREHQFTGSNL